MKKIKVLFIIDRLRTIGGTERYLFQLATKLNKDRFSCMVFPLTARQEIINQYRENGIEVIDIPIPRIYDFNAFRQFFKLRKLLKEKEIDIVQTFYFASDTYGALVSKAAGVSHIVSGRRDMGDLKKKIFITISRRANKLIDHFIMVVDAVGKSFAEKEGIPLQKMTTVYNGVDLTNWKPAHATAMKEIKAELNINTDAFVIGYVAHFRHGKGHNVLFEALKRMKPKMKNMKALVVGGREGNMLKEQYKQFCKDNHLEDNVIFKNYTEEVGKFYSAMDVYGLLSDNEGCSNSILEAMASGRPVIATAVGGNPELVKDGETGILVPRRDPDAVVQATLKLYQNPELRKQMGIQARQRVEKEFSLEKMVDNMENFYFQLCQNGTV